MSVGYVPGTNIILPFHEQDTVKFPKISDKKYEEIQGWFCSCQANLFADFIKECDEGANIVEIGTWLGKSTRFMAQLIKDSGKKINYWVIDTFKGSPEEKIHADIIKEISKDGSIRKAFDKNMVGLKRYMKVIESDSVKAASQFKDESLDLVFIDGDHSMNAVIEDILAYYHKLKTGGIMAGDDYHPTWGVYPAVNNLIGSLNLEIYGQVWRTKK